MSSLSSDGIEGMTIVVPVYNEEDTLHEVLRQWHAHLEGLGVPFHFLVIDDGSTDETPAILQGLEKELAHVQIVRKPNSGHGRSCRMGYEMACDMEHPWILQIDSDGQSDPRFLEAFWRARHDADCVFGFRHTRDDGWDRRLITKLCRLGVMAFLRIDTRDPNVPYRLIRKETLRKAVDRIPADFHLQNVALTVALARNGEIRWKWIPVHFPKRRGGRNSVNFTGLIVTGIKMLADLRRIR